MFITELFIIVRWWKHPNVGQRMIGKPNVVYPYNGTLEGSTDNCYKMDES